MANHGLARVQNFPSPTHHLQGRSPFLCMDLDLNLIQLDRFRNLVTINQRQTQIKGSHIPFIFLDFPGLKNGNFRLFQARAKAFSRIFKNKISRRITNFSQGPHMYILCYLNLYSHSYLEVAMWQSTDIWYIRHFRTEHTAIVLVQNVRTTLVDFKGFSRVFMVQHGFPWFSTVCGTPQSDRHKYKL